MSTENTNNRAELYQQVILEHHHKPRNFGEMKDATHDAEGYNPLCGDHLHVYLHVNDQNIIDNVSFSISNNSRACIFFSKFFSGILLCFIEK